MIVSKQIADVLTAARSLIAIALVWIGLTQGLDGLALAAGLLLLAWMTDALDGALARRSRRKYHSWLGDHDLQVDITVSLGLSFYLAAAEVITPFMVGAYLLAWVAIFAYWGFNRSLGMLVQAPIYGRFLWLVLDKSPAIGASLVAFLTILLIITWPRFPQEVIPGFLHGLHARPPDRE